MMKNAINLDNSFYLLSTKPTSAIELRNVIQMLTVIINRFDSRGSEIHLFPAKYRQSARISVIVHRFRQYGIEHLLLDTAHEVRYSAA